MNNNPVRYADPTGHMIITDGPDNDKFNKWLADQYKKEKISGETGEPSLPFESDTTLQDNNSCNSCDQGELIAAFTLFVVADAVIVGIPTVILFFVATTASAALYIEVMEIVLIPVNIIAAYMAFDSNCIAGFSPGY